MTWNLDVYILAAWRAAKCSDELWISYFGEKHMLYYRCSDWNFCCHITWHETWICKSCDMTSCDVLWRALNFVLLWKICVVLQICHNWNILSLHCMTWNVDAYICVIWRAVKCHGVLWRALNFVLRWRVYVVSYLTQFNSWMIEIPHYKTLFIFY
jgi:hypothetical protein